jgi:hypothetical protein
MCQRVDREKASRTEGVNQMRKRIFYKYANDACGLSGLGRQSWLQPAGGEGPAGPAGPKAEWAGKGSRAESEEERFLN